MTPPQIFYDFHQSSCFRTENARSCSIASVDTKLGIANFENPCRVLTLILHCWWVDSDCAHLQYLVFTLLQPLFVSLSRFIMQPLEPLTLSVVLM